jgi:hypothetical protein
VTHPPRGRSAPWPALLLAGLFFAFAAWAISTGRIPWRVANDQVLYHEPAAREFARQWPRFDFEDYLSVTTPGFHVLLAGTIRLGNTSAAGLQAASALIGAALVALAAWVAGRGGAWRGAAMAAPLAASVYVFQAGAWVLPDNLAWLGVAGVLALAFAPGWSVGRAAGAGVVLAALVFTRQNHLWAAGAVWAAGWCGREEKPGLTPTQARVGRGVLALAATLPALAIIGWFVALWDGLTPARYRAFHQGANLSTPAFVLGVIGAASLFYLPSLLPLLARLWRESRGWAWGAVGAGLLVALASPTTFDESAGRWTGLWALSKAGPTLGHVAPLTAALAWWGAIATAGWLAGLDGRRRLIALAALAGFIAAQTANAQCWQRYVEPLALLLVGWAASAAPRPESGPLRRGEVVGPLALALLLGWLNVRALRDAPRLEESVAPGTLPMGGPYVPKAQRPPT